MGLAEDVKGSASWEATQGQLAQLRLFLFFIFLFRQFLFCPTPVYIILGKYGVGVFCCLVVFACVPDRILSGCVLEEFMESTDYEYGNDWNS